MENMLIERAREEDLPALLCIYEKAREFMRASGNESQWQNCYPGEELIKEDIREKRLFVVRSTEDGTANTSGGAVHGAFMFYIGDDTSYAYIEDGDWLSLEPYGVIHRVASDGQIRGMMRAVVNYCKGKIQHLRIDTHADNHFMQMKILENGFVRCGIVYMEDGSPRTAYELV